MRMNPSDTNSMKDKTMSIKSQPTDKMYLLHQQKSIAEAQTRQVNMFYAYMV